MQNVKSLVNSPDGSLPPKPEYLLLGVYFGKGTIHTDTPQFIRIPHNSYGTKALFSENSHLKRKKPLRQNTAAVALLFTETLEALLTKALGQKIIRTALYQSCPSYMVRVTGLEPARCCQ